MVTLRAAAASAVLAIALTSCGSPQNLEATSAPPDDDASVCNRNTTAEPPLSPDGGYPSDDAAIAALQEEARQRSAEARRRPATEEDDGLGPRSEAARESYYQRLERTEKSDSHAVWQTKGEGRVEAEVRLATFAAGRWYVGNEFYLLPPSVCQTLNENRQERLRRPPDRTTTTS